MSGPDKNCDRTICGRKNNFKVVMVRHGESEWNKANIFTGWYDSDLSDRGREEAKAAGVAILNANYKFDIAFCSVLTRAVNTLRIILQESNQPNVPIEKTWRLNERHYGKLTGLNKAQTAEQYGEDQVKIWRRSYNTPPPPMDETHPYYEAIVKDPRYADGPSLKEFPVCESLKLTIARTLPFWNNTIVPAIRAKKKVLIVAHGNSLRGIVQHLEDMSEDDIMGLNLPTGIPFYYELDHNMEPTPDGKLQFMGDEETVIKAMEEVAAQGKKN